MKPLLIKRTTTIFSIIIIFFVTIEKNTFCQSPYYNVDYIYSDKEIIDTNIQHTIYLLGDAGDVNLNKPSALDILEPQLNSEGKHSTIIILGDNIYPEGLPDSSSSKRSNAEIDIQSQLNILKEFKGNIHFIPGNHDWNNWSKTGWTDIKREEKYIEEQLDRGNTFLPDLGCPGPVTIKINDSILLVIIDTEWAIHGWELPGGQKSKCTISSNDDFINKLETIINANLDKNVIIAGHHPLFSNGKHGGHYPLRDHLFPLTEVNKNLYIPLPIIGSIYTFYKKYKPTIQDIKHKKYQILKKDLLRAFSKHNSLIYAAGHEHNLQYFKNSNQHYIISGSGSKTKYVSRGKGVGFSYAQLGFAKLLYLNSGEIWVEFWSINKSNKKGKVVFRNRLK